MQGGYVHLCKVLVGSLSRALGKGYGSWTHKTSTLTRKCSVVHAKYFHVDLSPMPIGLFVVLDFMSWKLSLAFLCDSSTNNGFTPRSKINDTPKLSNHVSQSSKSWIQGVCSRVEVATLMWHHFHYISCGHPVGPWFIGFNAFPQKWVEVFEGTIVSMWFLGHLTIRAPFRGPPMRWTMSMLA